MTSIVNRLWDSVFNDQLRESGDVTVTNLVSWFLAPPIPGPASSARPRSRTLPGAAWETCLCSRSRRHTEQISADLGATSFGDRRRHPRGKRCEGADLGGCRAARRDALEGPLERVVGGLYLRRHTKRAALRWSLGIARAGGCEAVFPSVRLRCREVQRRIRLPSRRECEPRVGQLIRCSQTRGVSMRPSR